jgi:hypothetical protein
VKRNPAKWTGPPVLFAENAPSWLCMTAPGYKVQAADTTAFARKPRPPKPRKPLEGIPIFCQRPGEKRERYASYSEAARMYDVQPARFAQAVRKGCKVLGMEVWKA